MLPYAEFKAHTVHVSVVLSKTWPKISRVIFILYGNELETLAGNSGETLKLQSTVMSSENWSAEI